MSVKIQDFGPGIDEENIQKIFMPLYSSENTSTENMGLGLPLAKAIMKLHKGTIEMFSDLGKGTLIDLQLPLGK